MLYGICQLPNSQIHSQYHWEALASLKIAISSSTGTGNGFVSWTTVIKIIIHSKKFWTSDVWTANGYRSAHATVCALKKRLLSNVSDQCLTFFSCDNCLHSPKVLFSWFSLKFLFLFVRIYRSTVCAQTDSKLTSKIFVNRLCTNVRLTICAQMFQCTNSAQEHLSSDTSNRKRRANGHSKYSTVWHL